MKRNIGQRRRRGLEKVKYKRIMEGMRSRLSKRWKNNMMKCLKLKYFHKGKKKKKCNRQLL